MKKLVLLMMIALMAIPCFGDATRWNIRKRPTADWLTGATGNKDTAWAWMKAIDLLVGGSNVNQGTVYYVDDNSGLDTHDGLSWNNAVKTITKAMALSHAMIGTSPHYADRNTIFVRGDDFDEDWTLLAQKTNIIGVGSDDGSSYPTVKGNHPITAMTSSTTFMGCKFYNMGFQPQTAAALWNIPADQHQIEFHYCTFQEAANSIYGITVVSSNGLVIKNCRFIRDVGTNMGFLTAAINIGNGTIVHTDIADNFIDAEVGIVVYNAISSLGGRITGNFIHATTLTIDENSNTFWIVNNTLISEAIFSSGYDFDDDHAVGNILTGSDITRVIPVIDLDLASKSIKDTGISLTSGNVVNCFVIAGGPILVKSLIVEITTGVDTQTALISFQADPTVGSATPITNVTGPDISDASAGDFFYDEGDGTALIKAGTGTALPFAASGVGIIVPVGDIDLLLSTSAPNTGVANIYMRYTPMVMGVTVTAP